MTNEDIKVLLNNQLKSIEKVIIEGFEKQNERMVALEAGFECNQERFDVLEEHVVSLVEDMNEIKKKYIGLENAVLEHNGEISKR
ncbi:MAG: hypothetical protein AB2374_11920 [Cytobacillus gottheilii]|uniref:hypothetical protein n=1 Tax=Cytobacillus gottheilii TaxID=859144 RepID=UPI00346457F2